MWHGILGLLLLVSVLPAMQVEEARHQVVDRALTAHLGLERVTCRMVFDEPVEGVTITLVEYTRDAGEWHRTPILGGSGIGFPEARSACEVDLLFGATGVVTGTIGGADGATTIRWSDAYDPAVLQRNGSGIHPGMVVDDQIIVRFRPSEPERASMRRADMRSYLALVVDPDWDP